MSTYLNTLSFESITLISGWLPNVQLGNILSIFKILLSCTCCIIKYIQYIRCDFSWVTVKY